MADWWWGFTCPQPLPNPLLRRAKCNFQPANANKLIRQYIPKGTDFSTISSAFIRKIQYKINRRPRKKLNFDCPKNVFFRQIANFANHDVEFNEKEQTFYIYNLLHFSIEPLDSFSKSYTYDFFWRTKGTCREVDTICLKKRISKKFKAIESSSYKQEFRYNPSYIRLLPNTQYVIRHDGMGAKVNIIKYFYTDSSGNLHYKCDEKSSRKLQEP